MHSVDDYLDALMPMHSKRSVLSLIFALALTSAMSCARADPQIAGLQPDRRPVSAPVIKEMEKDAQWYRDALKGISSPYPASLRFLEDQGNWYTPFNRPNMTGRYDIRALYPKKD